MSNAPLDIKQRLRDLSQAALRASQPRATSMVDPLFAMTAAVDALARLERLERFGIHMLVVHEQRTQEMAQLLIEVVDAGPSNERPRTQSDAPSVALDDPDYTSDMRALQLKYEQLIAELLLRELPQAGRHGPLCMINALSSHLVRAIQLLKKNGALTEGTQDRLIERLRRHLEKGS